ncbi:hypothetical protein ABZ892_27945 [Streptomyces sp. NPDC046924]|uniref:hypothetical protein n=1 Tax=Streptomyces sp. NPDC046924 TaxID=3155136 RepID=UPI0033E685D2
MGHDQRLVAGERPHCGAGDRGPAGAVTAEEPVITPAVPVTAAVTLARAVRRPVPGVGGAVHGDDRALFDDRAARAVKRWASVSTF